MAVARTPVRSTEPGLQVGSSPLGQTRVSTAPGVIVRINPAASRMLGYAPDELLGRSA